MRQDVGISVGRLVAFAFRSDIAAAVYAGAFQGSVGIGLRLAGSPLGANSRGDGGCYCGSFVVAFSGQRGDDDDDAVILVGWFGHLGVAGCSGWAGVEDY